MKKIIKCFFLFLLIFFISDVNAKEINIDFFYGNGCPICSKEEKFLEEIEKICEYISDKLKNIDASNRLREKVMYNVLLLEDSPKMFVEIEKTDKTKRAYRKIIVDNYTVLYTIDEENKIAYIAHIYYRRQNYIY